MLLTPASPPSLLVETFSSLDGRAGQGSLVAGQPDGTGWVLLADLLTDQTVLDGNRGVACASMAGDLSRASFEPVVDAVMGQRRAWHLDADALAVHRSTNGRCDGLAVLSPTVRVLPDDPRADDRDAVVLDDVETLRATVADETVALLTQVFDAFRIRGSVGVRGMWGTVADQLGSLSIWRSSGRGANATAITRRFHQAMNLADDPVDRPPVATDPCEPGKGYCTTCPLRVDGSRQVAYTDYWSTRADWPDPPLRQSRW